MTGMIMEFKGSGTTGKHCKMELYEDKVVIVKKSGGLEMLAQGMLTAALQHGSAIGQHRPGEKAISIDQIASIQVNAGGLLAPGFIRVLTSDSIQEGSYDFRHANADDMALSFLGKAEAEKAKKFKAAVEELKSKRTR